MSEKVGVYYTAFPNVKYLRIVISQGGRTALDRNIFLIKLLYGYYSLIEIKLKYYNFKKLLTYPPVHAASPLLPPSAICIPKAGPS